MKLSAMLLFAYLSFLVTVTLASSEPRFVRIMTTSAAIGSVEAVFNQIGFYGASSERNLVTNAWFNSMSPSDDACIEFVNENECDYGHQCKADGCLINSINDNGDGDWGASGAGGEYYSLFHENEYFYFQLDGSEDVSRMKITLAETWGTINVVVETSVDGHAYSSLKSIEPLRKGEEVEYSLVSTADSTWSAIDADQACEINDEGIDRTWGGTVYTLDTCKQKCDTTIGCVAIDFFSAVGWCNTYATACTNPLRADLGAASYKKMFPEPTSNPSNIPTSNPSNIPTYHPSNIPTSNPSNIPTSNPSNLPTSNPSNIPTSNPSNIPTCNPTDEPSVSPSDSPTFQPSNAPTFQPSNAPTSEPTVQEASADEDTVLSSMLDSFLSLFTSLVQQEPKTSGDVHGSIINIYSFVGNEIGGDVSTNMKISGSKIGSGASVDSNDADSDLEEIEVQPRVVDESNSDSDDQERTPVGASSDSEEDGGQAQDDASSEEEDGGQAPVDASSDSEEDGGQAPAGAISEPAVLSGECMSEENVLLRSRPQTGNMNYVDPPQNVLNVQNILSEESWNELFEFRNELYQYEHFLRSAAIWPHFCSDASLCATELSYVFAHMTQETGLNNPSEGPVWKQGLFHFSEMCANTEAGCSGYTAWDNLNSEWWPPVEPEGIYYGRGAKQLTWNYNYGPFSLLMTGDKMTFLNNPELVEDPRYALSAAIWFYMTPQSPKPSMHDVVTGCWRPNAHDISNGRTANSHANKMALTTHIINGGVECSQTGNDQPWKRFTYLVEFSNYFNVEDRPLIGDYVDCGTIAEFDVLGASADLLLFYTNDWAFDSDPDNCGCKLVGWYTGYWRTLDMLGDCEKAKCGRVTGQSDCSKLGREHGWREGTSTVNNCGSDDGPSSSSNGAQDLPNRCGTSWGDANSNCGNTRCLSQDTECPSGQQCFAGLTTASCETDQSGGSSNQDGDVPNRCGIDWADANANCDNTRCVSQDTECPSGQSCFTGLTTPSCESGGNSDQSNQGSDVPNRCGIDWADANANCGNTQCVSQDTECPSGQSCFTGLTTPSCESGGNSDQSNQGSDVPNRCGIDWADANANCGNTRCVSQDTECPSGQSCFTGLTTPSCETGGNSDQSNQGSDVPNRCGIDWADANANCGNTQCVSQDTECPSGQSCFTGLTTPSCESGGNSDQSNQGSDVPNRCGIDWADANDNCDNTRCVSQDTECPSGQSCFTGLTTPSCETDQSGGDSDQSNQDESDPEDPAGLPACLTVLDDGHIRDAGGLTGFTSATPDCEAYQRFDPAGNYCVYDYVSEVCPSCRACAMEMSRRKLNVRKSQGRRLLTLRLN